MDFVSNARANGRRIKGLTSADAFTHACVELAATHLPHATDNAVTFNSGLYQ